MDIKIIHQWFLSEQKTCLEFTLFHYEYLFFYSVGVATKIFSSNLTFLREDISMLCRSFAIFFLFFFSPNTVTVFSPQLEWMSAYDICTVYCRPRWFTCMVNMLVLFYHVRDFYKWLYILCMLDNYLKKTHIKYIVLYTVVAHWYIAHKTAVLVGF